MIILAENNNNTLNTAAPDDHLSMKYQDRAYNDAYKQWRRRKKDSTGFYYVSNPNELTYRDGFGFVKAYPEAEEAETLRHIYDIIGFALLIFALSDGLQTYILPYLLNKLGADIYYDFFADKLYGDSWLVFGLHSFFEITKRIFVFWFCCKKLQMPTKVMLPMKITNKPMFRASVPIMLLVSAVCVVLSAGYNIILGLVKIEPTAWVRLPEKPLPMALTLIVDIIVVSVLSEICQRGLILQLLRQFGDGSAIFISSFITACVSYNLSNFCYIFLASMAIGYFTVRTGSVATAIIMRITSRLFAYCIYFIDIKADESVRAYIIMAFLLVCIVFGIFVAIRTMVKHGDKFGISMHSRYMSFSQKVVLAISRTPISLWITATFIMAVMHIQFRT